MEIHAIYHHASFAVYDGNFNSWIQVDVGEREIVSIACNQHHASCRCELALSIQEDVDCY